MKKLTRSEELKLIALAELMNGKEPNYEELGRVIMEEMVTSIRERLKHGIIVTLEKMIELASVRDMEKSFWGKLWRK